ncbi:hypothetical protein HY495_01370 [Candidatus Woesearchaeota archaeon]|nr:hypothetical protein [Candidatus Woesearchaeota archaeon]
MASLKDRLEQVKNKIGLVGTRLDFAQPISGKGISEHITHNWQEVVIRIRRDLDLCPDDETRRFLEKKANTTPLETLATDLLYHGCGHRELPTYTGMGCPYTVQYHDLILDGISRALKEKGKQGLEAYVANAFEDVLNNTNVRRHTPHVGQILFWNNEGLECEVGKYPAFYEAFVKVNLGLMGSAEDVTLLRRFCTNDPKVQAAVQQFKTYLKQTLDTPTLARLHENNHLVKKLFAKDGWRDMAYQFALATADLLEQQPQMRLCFGLPEDGNPFDKEMRIPGTQEDLAEGRYKAGLPTSEHTDSLLQLDALYRKISRAIPVETADYTRASGIPLVHYGRRDLREDEMIHPQRIKGIGVDENGELTLRVARHQLQHPAQYKVQPRKFPKLKVALLDRSGSMGLSPDNNGNVGDKTFIPWGDRSKYHFALKGIYGIDNFLERQGISDYVESEIVTFGSTTQTTGKGCLRREEERRALLRVPNDGSTTINPAVLQNGEKAFLVSISDGEIQNWDETKAAYKTVIEAADYCHIHIGARNTFTQDLESWGVPVQYVRGDDDFSRLLLDVTSTYYKNGNFTP